MDCQQAVQFAGIAASVLVVILTMVGVGLIFTSCPDPSKHPEGEAYVAPWVKKADDGSFELCKLHQRPVDQCKDMHDEEGKDE